MEVPDLVRNAARRSPDRTCVVEGDRALSFADVDARASRTASALTRAGLRPGDRVALLAHNELEYLEIQAAVQRAGMTLVPLNTRLSVPELEFLVADSTPRLLIHGPDLAGAAGALGVERKWYLGGDGVGEPYDEVTAAEDASAGPGMLVAGAPATIIYTSGTTGRPKGAVISNGALWARLNVTAVELGVRPGDVFVQVLPMFHIAAHLCYGFSHHGATTVMVKAFDPASLIRTIEERRATHVMLVPTIINLLGQEPTLEAADLSALRLISYGASPIAPDVLRRAIAAFPRCEFMQLFGMTETFCASMLRAGDHDPDGHPEWLASAGTDAVSFETRVVDEQGGDVGPGVVGEILSRGPCLMDGYWNAPEATEEALAGGWMHTGDLGYRSEDGYLFVTDRLKDMIVSGGENVYPREVEDVIYGHPQVLEVAVVGIPDERWGEAVHAIVVPKEPGALGARELIEHCRPRLAGYKIPKSVELVEELPKNPTGKILKRLVRERYWEGAVRRVG
ncbi:MAG: long-chain-fatty-acid--CoA ligase [Acidimicrobiia bacterium]|nr:long-chain-fatty-acid--CoA ligase [Acidimicrobiia bacterium]